MPRAIKIAFLGTGLMGLPMAKNLLAAGHSVTVWNRTKSKVAALSELGAICPDTPAAAIGNAAVIISMLSDGTAVADLMQESEMLAALRPQSLWIDMSSTKPAEARDQSALLQAFGVAHLDAPVSGGTLGAAEASLAIMVGGTRTAFEAAEPILSVFGQATHVGPSGTGQLAKLANQAVVGITIAAVAEAMLMLESGGADAAAVRDALRGGFADSTILQQHGSRMTGGDFAPGGKSKSQLKDLDNVLEVAQQLNLNLPATQHIRDRYAHLVHAMASGDLDHAALFLELKTRNRTCNSHSVTGNRQSFSEL